MRRGAELKEEQGEELIPLNDSGGHQSLLGVQVGGGLIDEVHVGRFSQTEREGDSLQLTSGQVLYLWAEQRQLHHPVLVVSH